MSREILQADFIPIDLDNMIDSKGDSKLSFDREFFDKGLTCGSYFAGIATALFNAGIEEENVARILSIFVERFAETEI